MAFIPTARILWLAASQIDAFTTIPHHYVTTTLPSVKKAAVHRQRFNFLSSAVSDIQNQIVAETLTTTSSSPSKPHKRRERYSGRYPKNFNDKYKERQGDEATISKVLAKGMTPAGQHVPIMVKECLHYMGLEEYQQKSEPILVVDCTLGYGGHSSYILKQIMNSTDARLIAFDQDSVEIKKTEERLRSSVLKQNATVMESSGGEEIFTAVNQNFAELGAYMTATNQLGKVTSLLADLGLSSMQIDNNDRGFTYKRDGPLDMRMNPNDDSIETAYQLLQRLRVRQLKSILKENSDEEFAAELAVGLIGKGNKIPATTIELADRVRDIARPLIEKQNNWNSGQQLGKNQAKKLKSQLDSTIARVMQAIRIEVNGEFHVLDKLLDDLPTKILSPGGRVVMLTFHSGEDRRVKKSFKSGFNSGIYSAWSSDVVRPTKDEKRDNPRSSCCKLRWAVRSDQNAS
jgi:16S rRNA (cytosine1402-N4)-methyltransferase